VTVSFKTKDHVERMVESALKYIRGVDFEIIVVNHDKGERLELPSLPNVRSYTQRNKGFAAGCNSGIKKAHGRYIALINPDVVFSSDSLTQIVKHMDEDVDVGIAGPRLYNMDGTSQPSVRRFPTPIDQLLIMLKIPHFLTNLPQINHYLHTDLDPDVTQDVDQVMGAYFVIRDTVLKDIGLLDDKFFFWFEEVDYCLRAKTAGWKVRYYADTSAMHVKAGSFSRVKTFHKQAVIRQSLRRYMKKHHGWKGYLLFLGFEPVLKVLGIIAHVIKRR